MSPESSDISLHGMVLIATLLVLSQDLSIGRGGGGAQAWTYNYSTTNRGWYQARQWCQENFLDMLAIHSKEENDFITDLLPVNEKHYWIGIIKKDEEWRRVGTNDVVPKESQYWAPGEPNDIKGEDCVEIYIQKGEESGMWNDFKCIKKKGVVCYSALCTQNSCSAHADCVETVGNYTCQCHPGFLAPSCEEAIACKPLLDPEQGSQHCFHPYGSNRFNSSCRFHCELGFHLTGVPQLTCQASGQWNHPVPLCQVEQCPVLNRTSSSGGSLNCSHPIAPHSYNSTCEVRCDEGYELRSGDGLIRCDHTGQWTASVPTCTIKKCAPILFPPTGNVTCVDTVEPFSFRSRCDFTCQEGYSLSHHATLTCMASGQWSRPTPACEVVQCSHLEPPPHSTMQCQDPLAAFSYDSTCMVQCQEGFELMGSNITKCSSKGNWSQALPACQAQRCDPINPPPHGSISCIDPHGPFGFGSQCTSACDIGFLLSGSASTDCTSLGMWSTEVPVCAAVRCLSLNSTNHGALVCSHPHGEFSFGSRCNTTCEEGFLLNGTFRTECTVLGTWSADVPVCTAKRCPSLSPAPHSSLSCSHQHGEFSFDSRCNSTCEEGFLLNGTSTTECSSLGTWNSDAPICSARRCPTPNPPAHGTFVCSHPHGEFSFGSRCNSTCEEGFLLKGAVSTDCTAVGSWSAEVPICIAKRCSSMNPAPHGSLSCLHPHGEFSFGSWCNSSCEEGFLLNGTSSTECTSAGVWSADIPVCMAKRCPSLSPAPHCSLTCRHPHGEFSFASRCNSTCEEGFLPNGTSSTECTSLGSWNTDIPLCTAKRCSTVIPPAHGILNCSHPHGHFSFGSRCSLTCEEGFLLNGTADTECSSVGTWNTNLPLCTAIKCPSLHPPSYGSLSCSDPHGEFSLGSRCTSTCQGGFVLNGTADSECTSLGSWSRVQAQCLAERPLGEGRAALLKQGGIGAAAVLLPLTLIALALLMYKKFKNRGKTQSTDLWAAENPAFEL